MDAMKKPGAEQAPGLFIATNRAGAHWCI